jgi:hypothetical protein
VQHHCIIQALFIRAQRLDARYYTGERSRSLWKDRCASAHAPATENSDKSSARIPQTAHRVEMAYAYTRLILAFDRRIFDIPLEEHFQSRTSDLVAWPRQCMQLSIRAFAELRRNFVPGITTSILFLLHDSGRTNHERDAQRPDSTDHYYSSYRL